MNFYIIESTVRAIINRYEQGIVVTGAIFDRNWKNEQMELYYEGELDVPIPTFFWKSCLIKNSDSKFCRYTWLLKHRVI